MRSEIKPVFEPLSGREVLAVKAASISRSLARMLVRPVVRDTGKVAREYHGGHWARVLAERQWESTSGLEAFLIGHDQTPIIAKVDGQICRIKRAEYYRYRIDALAQLIGSSLGDEHDIVEVGCGFGYNLFGLALSFPNLRLTGVDISANGIEAARAIARHFGISNRVQFELLDVTKPDDRNFALLNGRACFTYFCLEQIPYDVEQVVKNILMAKPSRVLHVEPTTKASGYGRRDWVNYLYVKSMDYQSRLFTVLRELDQAGHLHLLRTGQIPFAPTIQNDGFSATWEPIG